MIKTVLWVLILCQCVPTASVSTACNIDTEGWLNSVAMIFPLVLSPMHIQVYFRSIFLWFFFFDLLLTWKDGGGFGSVLDGKSFCNVNVEDVFLWKNACLLLIYTLIYIKLKSISPCIIPDILQTGSLMSQTTRKTTRTAWC